MRIYVEPGGYTSLNLGDLAMLQVAVRRLRRLWPGALIQVPTEDPESLRFHCPQATPLAAKGRHQWFQERYLLGRFHKLLPARVSHALSHGERSMRRCWPALVKLLLQTRMKLRAVDSRLLEQFLDAVLGADLVLVSGMGGLNDTFPKSAVRILDTLDLAMRHRKPTAALSQGIGPFESGSEAWQRSCAVLPRVSLIALREGRAGLPSLRSMRVDMGKVVVTGDDAVELAYCARSKVLGTSIGVNFRVARYSGMDGSLLDRIRPSLQRVSKTLGAPLLPLPTSRNLWDSDVGTLRTLLGLETQHAHWDEESATVENLLRKIQTCRVVVTGSYHAGVFALSQGIPAVVVATSDYYVDKFLGLREQFGAGCEVVVLDSRTEALQELERTVRSCWDRADQLRGSLLRAAEAQIQSSLSAYQKLPMLLESRRKAA